MFKNQRIYGVVAILIGLLYIVVNGVVASSFNTVLAQIDKVKQDELKSYIVLKELELKKVVDAKIIALETEFLSKEKKIQEMLQSRIEQANDISIEINKKNRYKKQMIKSLKQEFSLMRNDFNETDIFLVDYSGDTLYGSNHYPDADARTIVLEEVQKVRRRGGGFIVSKLNAEGMIRYILVKDLGFRDLFIGVNFISTSQNWYIKNAILQDLENDESNNLAVVENNITILDKFKNTKSSADIIKYTKMQKSLEWDISASFEMSEKNIELQAKYTQLKRAITLEQESLYKTVLFTFLTFLIFSLLVVKSFVRKGK